MGNGLVAFAPPGKINAEVDCLPCCHVYTTKECTVSAVEQTRLRCYDPRNELLFEWNALNWKIITEQHAGDSKIERMRKMLDRFYELRSFLTE